MTAAEAIRHIRKRLGKNQAEFAQMLRCRQNTVSRYERGRLAPSALALVGLLDLANPEEKRALAGQLEEYSRRGIIGPSVEQFTEGVKPLLDEMQLSLALMDLLTVAKRNDFGFRQFVPAVAHVIESCPTVDASIPEILHLWAAHRERPQTAALLRDVLGFLRKMLWGTPGVTDS